ncbi:ATP-binding cassette domain-containing protein [Klebsiella pneumoniae]|nr:ATP-binding cassette domain-containing protein [Klebsiella pneumoniae]ROC35693.1 ATP-binding cassette domain-containing protein [Klebsiella pneumoniae subsp. pneumoniae]MBK3122177.1 ATP-binding cassette domain-containing protein [Klebsiella pneumoniae]MCJ4889231.1 ATP-binding cassette domain-containing protein [Klebsiella pneumoniae]OSH96461.1 hypothetical protein B7D73_15610 [Klebsiella pneumoniae]
MTDSILRVEHLMMHFGGIKALNDVNLEVERGSITALIGPNGAGKTTVFNCLTGFYRATGGSIVLRAREKVTDVIQVLGQKLHPDDFLHPAQLGRRIYYKMFGGTHLVNRAGLARTFQNIRLFREMSVIENLLVAQHTQVNRHLLAGILNTRGYRQAESQALDRAFYWLEVVEMVDCANRLAGTLSYGQQRRLEIARAMCTRPEMICLDEPAAGLNPVETQALSRIIRFLRQQHGITVLLIEHDMGMVMEISDHIIVLDHGDVIARGAPQAIQALKQVSLTVNEGETVALIGANGAGKSTLLMSVFGQPRIAGGEIFYRGEAISRKSTHFIASNGIAQAPEGRRIFPDMTVEENLLMGTIAIGNRYQAEDKARMYQLFPRLEERRGQRAMTLSGGEQQMLAIARALMSRPRLLLLDEPSLGLAPLVVKQIFQILRELTAQGMTLFLVEQNARHALNLSDRAYVMVNGQIRLSGSGQTLLNDPEVRKAYLGISG